MQTNRLFLALSLLASSRVEAFTAPTRNPLKVGVASSAPGLSMVGAAIEWEPEEQDEAFLMNRAAACADSESCSLDDARMYLDDVIRIQSGCVTGTVLGSVCDNVDTAAEVVANLRQKIQDKSQQAIVVATSVNVVSVGITALILAALASGMTAMSADSTPFTPQEWWWAIRDGYLPQMLSHYFRHGGLATSNYDAETTPFHMQEWWWALQGGYLNTMVEHFFRNGGLATAENFSPDTVPFTPQEWLYAVKGGYVDKLLVQNFQDGGLAGSEALNTDTLALTPQEIFWAVRDGYLGDLSSHFFRNGGL